MEYQKPKIALYVRRPFGDKLSVSFEFIKENWKVILKFCTYLILPICLIQSISINGVMDAIFGMAASQAMSDPTALAGLGIGFWLNYILLFFCYAIGGLLLSSLIYALFKIYNERENRLVGLTFSELTPVLFRNIRRLIVLFFFGLGLSVVVCLVFALLVYITPWTLVITLPALVAVVVPMALFTPIYLMEDITLLDAFKKTFRLGFATWGGVLGIGLVMGFAASMIQTAAMMPWYVALIVKNVFLMSGEQNAMTASAGYEFALYLLAIIQTFGVYLSMILSMVGMVFQYGHACEVVDHVSVESDIDKFETL